MVHISSVYRKTTSPRIDVIAAVTEAPKTPDVYKVEIDLTNKTKDHMCYWGFSTLKPIAGIEITDQGSKRQLTVKCYEKDKKETLPSTLTMNFNRKDQIYSPTSFTFTPTKRGKTLNANYISYEEDRLFKSNIQTQPKQRS